MTLAAAHSASTKATMSRVMDFCPRARNCVSTISSVVGGSTVCSARESVAETKSARVITRMVAAEVRTGKKESSAEYAAPLAMEKQPSSMAARRVRRSRKGKVRQVGRTWVV